MIARWHSKLLNRIPIERELEVVLVRIWRIIKSSLSRSYINWIGALDRVTFSCLSLEIRDKCSAPFSKEEIEEAVFNLGEILLIRKEERRWFLFRVYSGFMGFVRSGSHKVMEECWH